MSNDSVALIINQKSGMGSETAQAVHVHVNKSVKVHCHLTTIKTNNLTFNPQQLKTVIESIDDGLSEFHTQGRVSFEPGICMTSKNKLNKFDQEFFDDVVVDDFYPQFTKIDRFLSLRVNESLKGKVDRIILSLNRRIKAHSSHGLFFQELLYEICDALIDKEKDALEDKEEQVLLVLYYFYSNCCIGKKTEEEKNAGS